MKNTKLLPAVLLIGIAVSISYTTVTQGVMSLTPPETTVSKEIPQQEAKIVPFAKVMEPAFAEDYVDTDITTEVQFVATGKGCNSSKTINKYEKMKYITFRALPPGQLGEKNPLSGEIEAQLILIPKDKTDSIFSAKAGDILVVKGRPVVEKYGYSLEYTSVVFVATCAYKTGTETQHEASASQTQSILENQSKTSRSSQQTQGDKKKTSVNMEIPLDTVLRLERERIRAMGDAKARQIVMLQKEGIEYTNKRNWNSAVSVFKKTLEIDPESIVANGLIGSAYMGLDEFDLAVKYLTKANQLMPANPIPYVNLAIIYAIQGDKDRAMELLQEAVDRGYKDIDHIKNDNDLPEDFRNDPRLNNFIK